MNVEKFAVLVGIRDTWQRSSPQWDLACAQAEALVFFGWERLRGQTYLNEHQLAVGKLLYDKKKEKARKQARNAYIIGDVALFNDRYSSDVADALREQGSKVKLAVGFSYVGQSDGTMHLIFSLRTLDPSVNAAAIAKANGGGGHTAAAGFTIKGETPQHAPLLVLTNALSKAGCKLLWT